MSEQLNCKFCNQVASGDMLVLRQGAIEFHVHELCMVRKQAAEHEAVKNALLGVLSAILLKLNGSVRIHKIDIDNALREGKGKVQWTEDPDGMLTVYLGEKRLVVPVDAGEMPAPRLIPT
jgi:hypothetical protein